MVVWYELRVWSDTDGRYNRTDYCCKLCLLYMCVMQMWCVYQIFETHVSNQSFHQPGRPHWTMAAVLSKSTITGKIFIFFVTLMSTYVHRLSHLCFSHSTLFLGHTILHLYRRVPAIPCHTARHQKQPQRQIRHITPRWATVRVLIREDRRNKILHVNVIFI